MLTSRFADTMVGAKATISSYVELRCKRSLSSQPNHVLDTYLVWEVRSAYAPHKSLKPWWIAAQLLHVQLCFCLLQPVEVERQPSQHVLLDFSTGTGRYVLYIHSDNQPIFPFWLTMQFVSTFSLSYIAVSNSNFFIICMVYHTHTYSLRTCIQCIHLHVIIT